MRILLLVYVQLENIKMHLESVQQQHHVPIQHALTLIGQLGQTGVNVQARDLRTVNDIDLNEDVLVL